MDHSIIVRTHNDESLLRSSLEKVFAQVLPGENEYILVDEASTDRTVAIAEQFPFDRIVQLDTFNAAHTLNTAYGYARGKYIINILGHTLLDNDNAMNTLIATLADGQYAAVYGRQVPHPEGDVFLNVHFTMGYPLEGGERPFCSLAFSALVRSVWEQFPFQTDYVPSEDKGWSIALRNAGLRILYEPDARVYHYHRCDIKRIFVRHKKVAAAHRRMGISKLKHYLSLHRAIMNDARYLENKWWLLLSPFYHMVEAVGYVIGWCLR